MRGVAVADILPAVRHQDEITAERIREYLDTFGLTSKLEPAEAAQFIAVCRELQLNPLKREVYCIPYGSGEKRKLSIVVGFETYLKRASRLGLLRGWRAWTEGTITPTQVRRMISYTDKRTGEQRTFPKDVTEWRGGLVAKVEIQRSDWTSPFLHEVDFLEYRQENDMWASKPRTMLKKVAIAQGFRLCFPDEFGGLPYCQEELPDAMTRAAPAIEADPVPPCAPPPVESADATRAEIRGLADELGLGVEERRRMKAAFGSDMDALLARLRSMRFELESPSGPEAGTEGGQP